MSIRWIIILTAAGTLAGCAGQRASTADSAPETLEASVTNAEQGAQASAPLASLRVQQGGYSSAFETARDVLRDYGFLLERVDAQLGVITTRPKGTAGLATIWDREQSDLGDEMEDFVHRNQRVVRLEFAPDGTQPGSLDVGDLRTRQEPINMFASVAVYRINQPGWRLNPYSVLHSTYARDPQMDARGMALYAVATRQDQDLADRVVAKIERKLSEAAAAAE